MKRVSFRDSGEKFLQPAAKDRLAQQLHNDGFLQLPEHEYVPKQLNAELVSEFATFAGVLKDIFHNRPGYPNARLFPAYSTTRLSTERIDFMLAWGDLTEQPLPRDWKIPEYFSRTQLLIAKRRRLTVQREMMDAQGVLGNFTFDEQHQPVVGIYSKSANGNDYIVQRQPFAAYSETSVNELASTILLANPLRFHSAVKHIPWNSYTGNIFYPDDESRIL